MDNRDSTVDCDETLIPEVNLRFVLISGASVETCSPLLLTAYQVRSTRFCHFVVAGS